MKFNKLSMQEILEKIKAIVISDTGAGFVGYDTLNNVYYCGLKTFDKQLRKALIYHDKKLLQDAIVYNKMENMVVLQTYVICDMSAINNER